MPKDIAAEAKEEAKEAETPGARGKEYRDKERDGDEGPAYKRGGKVERKRGGFMPEEVEKSEAERGQRTGKADAKKDKAPDKAEGMESYEDEARKRGGKVKHHPRKRGGHVPGKAPKSRPDRRARGGATSDLNPGTAAGNMSTPDYETQCDLKNGGGKGKDSRGGR